jgi:hypothetical protein
MNELNATIAELQASWALLFPEVPTPAPRQWALWITLHGQDVVRRSIAKLALRYQRSADLQAGDSLYRFASVIMSRMSKGAAV